MAFILLGAPDCVATIQGRRLIDDHGLKLSVKMYKLLLSLRKRVPVCTHTIVIIDQPVEKVQSYKCIWGFTFFLTYPGATMSLIYMLKG